MEAKEIVELTKVIRKEMNEYTNITSFCNANNIELRKANLNPKVFKAYTTCLNSKKIITINSQYYSNKLSRALLLCHELGHVYLHKDNYYNAFNGDNLQKEYEANLFALSLALSDYSIDLLDPPLHKMSAYELECIMNENIN